MNRRRFLYASAASLAGPLAGYAEARPRRAGLIGCGWYGKAELFRLMQTAPVEVVSLCDVDQRRLAQAAEMVAVRQASKKGPRTYGDYREMLRESDLDIVLIATPDHWHALPMIAAVEAGADVHVQMPISVDIAEGQAMLAAASKHRRVVQVGAELRGAPHIVEARARFLGEGRLGRIGLVEIYCYSPLRPPENPPESDPPPYLDYEMWTGPALMRPYNKRVHPASWRAFMEYGNGILGDRGVPMFDMVRWMLALGWPRRVSSEGGILVQKSAQANVPDTQTAIFEYDDLIVVWRHRTWGAPPDPDYPWGATFHGDRGTLKVSVSGYDFTPAEGRGERSVATAMALDTGATPAADIEQGYISTASCILANLSMRLGRTLEWDGAKQRIAGDDEANRLLARPYRRPWAHPAAG